MSTLNAYATLADYKDYIRSRNGNVPADTTDDAIIESLLVSASRYIDSQTGRHFYPFIETRYYSVPGVDEVDPRLLNLDADLLEVITLTNGDGTAIPSTEYKLQPKNSSPHYGIRLNDISTYYWATDASGDSHDVISVAGIWGCHPRYSIAWATITTAAEAMDASETGYDVTAGTDFKVADIIRFDNEFGYISSILSNTLTITRGENGSTATTHLTSIDVKRWKVFEEAKQACLTITDNAYRRRFGQTVTGTETVTASGIVLSPKDIPTMAMAFIKTYRRYV